MRNKLFGLMAFAMLASLIIAACTPTPGAVQTVIVAGTPMVVTATPEAPAALESKNPGTWITVSFGEPDSLDPAWDYETAGGEVLNNVYEPLVTYVGTQEAEFEGLLAESWTVSDDGRTYTFQLQPGVKFHDGADLTASDVVYSFVRGLLRGGTDSPQFLLAEPFFGLGMVDIAEVVEVAETAGLEALQDGISAEEYGAIPGALYDDIAAMQAKDPALLAGVCEYVYGLFEADDAAGTVSMTLALPWAPFIPTIAGYWSSAMDQDWVAANGGWDGSCDTWQAHYATAPEDNPINAIANGTGPFVFDHWTPGEEVVLTRNENYWREPAALERVVIQQVDEWSTRFAMMTAGDADWVAVPVENRSQMDALVGETCNWNADLYDYECAVTDESKPFRVYLGRPGNTRTDIFFNFAVANPDGSNTYLGSGELDGNGAPENFFNDVHIRRAFNYCQDWDTYNNDIFNGEAVQSKALTIPGMPGYNEDDPTYFYDPAKAEEEFKLADVDGDGIPAGEEPEDGGDVWNVGFRMSGTYNIGNTTRQTLALMLSNCLNGVNEKFQLEVVGLPWPTFLRSIRASLAPIFFVGWHEDIHDPHNWYVPYLVTTYAARQNVPAEIQDQFIPLINEGVLLSDPAARNEVYKELNQLVYDNAPGIILSMATSHTFLPRYTEGFISQPMYSNFYYYTMSD